MTLLVPPYCSTDPSHPDFVEGYPSVLHKIHVESFLSEEEAASCLELARIHAKETGCWNQPDRKRHAAYPTCDFAVEDCEDLEEYLEETLQFDNRMFDRLSHQYGIDPRAMSYIDFFCVNYQFGSVGDDKRIMDRLAGHQDGSLLSFSVTLSSPGRDFEGGGTFFDALRDAPSSTETTTSLGRAFREDGVVLVPRAGDAVMHSGFLFHGGYPITKGQRTVLIGFVDVDESCIRKGAMATACRTFGRLDVVKRHLEQYKKNQREGQSWNNSPWLSPKQGGSYLCLDRNGRRTNPRLRSMEVLSSERVQRPIRLRAEDKLLRTILLPPGERREIQSDSTSWEDDMYVLE